MSRSTYNPDDFSQKRRKCIACLDAHLLDRVPAGEFGQLRSSTELFRKRQLPDPFSSMAISQSSPILVLRDHVDKKLAKLALGYLVFGGLLGAHLRDLPFGSMKLLRLCCTFVDSVMGPYSQNEYFEMTVHGL